MRGCGCPFFLCLRHSVTPEAHPLRRASGPCVLSAEALPSPLMSQWHPRTANHLISTGELQSNGIYAVSVARDLRPGGALVLA
jgi:hypothetical protein